MKNVIKKIVKTTTTKPIKKPIKKELPDFYYLTHFDDLLHFVQQSCAHLLNAHQQAALTCYTNLDKNMRCLLARIFSRKPYVLAKKTIHYNDVNHPLDTANILINKVCLRRFTDHDITAALPHLTKADLLLLYKTAILPHSSTLHNDTTGSCVNASVSIGHTTIKSSMSKPDLQAALLRLPFLHCPEISSDITDFLNTFWIINNRADFFEYYEFLYFGKLSHDTRYRFHQFSLRDLGIRRTRKNANVIKPSFAHINEASSAYQYHLTRQHWLHVYTATSPQETIIDALNILTGFVKNNMPIGYNAITTHNKIWLYAYNLLRKNHIKHAVYALQQCINDDTATEKELRERYKYDDKNTIKQALLTLINDNSQKISPTLKQFASDFLTIKFNNTVNTQTHTKANINDNKKGTLPASDMLKNAQTLYLDEQHKGHVERAVKAVYTEKGYTVYRTENSVFLNLFSLVFWDELTLASQHNNEFDILPPSLKNNTFYTENKTAIDQKLARFTRCDELYHYCVKASVKYYGQPNGLIKWRVNMLEPLQALVYCSALSSIQQILKNMASHFSEYKSGYPDLLLEKDNRLTFIEVKAQGDKLSRSQVVTHNALNQNGFNVSIKKVAWRVNPKTVYAVVDVETTGGRSPLHRITEIAIVKIQNGKEINRWSSLVNPMRPIPVNITRLTGISNEMVNNAPTFSALSEEVLQQLSGCVFVAHNVNFDYGFIQREFERLGMRFKASKLCTVVESRKAFAGLKSYSLKNLCAHFDIELTQHHRALADASATAILLSLIQEENA